MRGAAIRGLTSHGHLSGRGSRSPRSSSSVSLSTVIWPWVTPMSSMNFCGTIDSNYCTSHKPMSCDPGMCVCLCMYVECAQARGGWRATKTSHSIPLCLSPLRQGLPLNLMLVWWPASPRTLCLPPRVLGFYAAYSYSHALIPISCWHVCGHMCGGYGDRRLKSGIIVTAHLSTLSTEAPWYD